MDTANVHLRNILGSRSSFDRERLSPFGSLNSALDRLANASYQIVIEGSSYRERLSPHRAFLPWYSRSENVGWSINFRTSTGTDLFRASLRFQVGKFVDECLLEGSSRNCICSQKLIGGRLQSEDLPMTTL